MATPTLRAGETAVASNGIEGGAAREVSSPAPKLRERVLSFAVGLLTALACLLFTGCSAWQFQNLPQSAVSESLLQEIKRRPNKIFLLTSAKLVPTKPAVLLLHGATDDPSEMMNIAGLWARTHNVLLYSYNFHKPLDDIADDLLQELKRVDAERSAAGAINPGMTVITYSYSAAVFRKAVLLAPDGSLFEDVSLIQLVPTAGGSFLARRMDNALTKSLVSVASKASAAENPFGKTAEELWGEEGTRIFNRRIDPRRTFSVLVPGDPHSLANIKDDAVRKRYENGIGPNVIVIPQRYHVTHDNAPHHPVTMDYLVILQSSLADIRRLQTNKTPAQDPARAPASAN